LSLPPLPLSQSHLTLTIPPHQTSTPNPRPKLAPTNPPPPYTAGDRGIDLAFIRQHAEPILRSSPIPYLRTAKLRGKIFAREWGSEKGGGGGERSCGHEDRGRGAGVFGAGAGAGDWDGDGKGSGGDEGEVACADTGFYVDHTETREVLRRVKEGGRGWVLGEVGEGGGFVLLIEGCRGKGVVGVEGGSGQ